jgi:hypothetical protein
MKSSFVDSPSKDRKPFQPQNRSKLQRKSGWSGIVGFNSSFYRKRPLARRRRFVLAALETLFSVLTLVTSVFIGYCIFGM